MADAAVTYFPVRNGDTILIRLSDGTSIVIDSNITQDSRDDSKKEWYDVHEHLLEEEVEKDGAVPYVDAFILTHPDSDHCRGFKDTFYTGDPANYSVFYTGDPAKYGDEHAKEGLIRIDELWFSPRIFSPREEGELAPSAKVFLKEARRRMDLYKAGNAERDNPGNRLRIIGSTEAEENEGLGNIVTFPGEAINCINKSEKEDFSFFVHAPFKEDVDSEEDERNRTSIVLQARFDVGGEEHAALAFFGGDATHTVWGNILDRTSDEENLRWDLFLAPHHCSWTYFGDTPYEDNQEPSEKSLKMLSKKREGAYVISSCKPVNEDDDNPPHQAAKELYQEEVGEDRFLVTSEEPDEEQPQPLVFTMSKNGPVKHSMTSPKSRSRARSSALNAAASKPRTYGRP